MPNISSWQTRVGSLRFHPKQKLRKPLGSIERLPPTQAIVPALQKCKFSERYESMRSDVMNHAFRKKIYDEIASERASKVIALVTGERNGMQTQIAPDCYPCLVSILDGIGPVPKISMILETMGGQTSAAWRAINLIRSFCDDLEVIIPTKAMSAGTLMALGADRIMMTKQAALGPIDPSIPNHPLAPTVPSITGQPMAMPVSAEAVRGYIEEVRKDVKDEASLAAVWTSLSSQIHPLILGDIFRIGNQIRLLARELIERQVKDQSQADTIINFLCSDSGSHDYTINRRKAADLGLNVEKPSAELYQKLMKISQSYAAELQTTQPVSPSAVLQGKATADYTYVRGLIESADECFGFVTEGTYTAAQNAPINDQRKFEGWRKLP